MTLSNSASEQPTLREWLQEAPFSLSMSSGFFGFFAHCGMLSVLEEEQLLPERLSGSSAGALVAGCWAAGTSARALSERLSTLERKDFWDPGLGWGFLRGTKFRHELLSLLPVHTFEECRVPLAVSLYEVRTRKTIVATQGSLPDALRASCAVPFLFQPVRWNERLYLDGGIADRPGVLGMPVEHRTLYHHLASRSPWRRKNGTSMKVPKREQLTALIIQGLPRVNPFRLERGMVAFQKAREATQYALDQALRNQTVEIHLDAKQLVAHV